MKRLLSLILMLCMMLSCFAAPAFAASNPPKIDGESAILLDMTTGEILYEKDSHVKQYPASTTKMITCILALENLSMDDVLTADEEVAGTIGTKLGLKSGEELTAEQAINVMMVMSANDCAVLIAKAVSGSVGEFAKLMNSKAKELGCTETNFVTPNGLHDDEHYSTAYDLSLIARYCMQNEVFRNIVRQESYTLDPTNKDSSPRTVQSTNLMLWDTTPRIYIDNVFTSCKYEGIIGIKTGYTSQALAAMVSAAQKDGTTLLCVVLKSLTYSRFADSIKLFNWGFSNYKTLSIFEAGKDFGRIKVKRGEFNKVEVMLPQSVSTTVPVEASSGIINTSVDLDESITAPFEAGAKVGTVTIYEASDPVATYDIVTKTGVARGGILSIFGIEDSTAKLIGSIALAVVGALFIALVAWVLVKRRETRIKRARRDARLKAKKEAEERARLEWEKQYDMRYLPPDDDSQDY